MVRRPEGDLEQQRQVGSRAARRRRECKSDSPRSGDGSVEVCNLSKERPVTASSSYPFIDATSTSLAANGLLRLAEEGFRRHGDLFAVRFAENQELVILASADHVGLWQQQTDHFYKDFDTIPSSASLTRLLLGPTLLTARQGAEWNEMRSEMTTLMRLSKPWFTRALEDATDHLVSEIGAGKGRAASLMPLALDWAVRSVCVPILGPAVKHESALELVDVLQNCFLAMVAKGGAKQQEFEMDPALREAKALIASIVRIAADNAKEGDETIIAACLATLPLGLGIAERDARLSGIVVGLIAASLHINALALVWTLMRLASDPLLSARIAAETADDRDGGQQVTKTPLAFAAVRETQRLYPALPFIERKTRSSLNFSGFEIPAGSTVLFAAWLIQRDPRYWPEPKQFDATRFTPGRKYLPNSYLPFGSGIRSCAGMNLVFQQLTFAVRRVISTFDIRFAQTCRPGDQTPVMRVNLEPRGDIGIVASERMPIMNRLGTPAEGGCPFAHQETVSPVDREGGYDARNLF
jgi:cytochrome P450